jgi:hypothetical protein
MLLHNLAKAAGVSSPHVTDVDVENYYQRHPLDYPPFPKNPVLAARLWHAINQDIRRKLAPLMQQTYEQQFQHFVEHFKSLSEITLM